MKGLLGGLLVCWGCLISEGMAQETSWRRVEDTPVPEAPPLWRQVDRTASVTLGQPVPLSTATAHREEKPAAWQGSVFRPVVYRAAMPETGILQSGVAMLPEPSTLPSQNPGAAGPAELPPGELSSNGTPQIEGCMCGFPGDCTSGDGACPPFESGFGLADLLGLPQCPMYASAEYLLWWMRDSHYPPLVITGTGINPTTGQIENPQTIVGGNVNNDLRSGGRFTVGFWCDSDEKSAVEGTFFFLGQRSVNYLVGSDAYPLLARPFQVANTSAVVSPSGVDIGGKSFEEIATFPNQVVGRITVETPSNLWGAEANYRCNLCCNCWSRIDLLAGFRYLQLDEGLHITESLETVAQVGDFPPGTQRTVVDTFDTRNQFYGGQLGLRGDWNWGPWSLDCMTKVALGDTHQTVNRDGYQVIQQPGAQPQFYPGGLLVLPNANLGIVSRDRFTVVPEINLSLSYHVTDWWRIFVGYNFLYWSSVARPGNQIDQSLDVTKIPQFLQFSSVTAVNPPRPAPIINGTPFWAQGITIGMEFRY